MKNNISPFDLFLNLKKTFTVSRRYELWSYTLIKNTLWKLICFQPFWRNMVERDSSSWKRQLEKTRSWKLSVLVGGNQAKLKVSLQSESSGWSWKALAEVGKFKWTWKMNCYTNWEFFQLNQSLSNFSCTFQLRPEVSNFNFLISLRTFQPKSFVLPTYSFLITCIPIYHPNRVN